MTSYDKKCKVLIFTDSGEIEEKLSEFYYSISNSSCSNIQTLYQIQPCGLAPAQHVIIVTWDSQVSY